MINGSCCRKAWLVLTRDWPQADDDVTLAAGAFSSERRGSTHLLSFLQDGALELLRELKNIHMNLETLQVFMRAHSHAHTVCSTHAR